MVLVRPEDHKEEGGILLPAGAQTSGMAERGTVLAAGPGRIDRDGAVVPMSVKAEDVVTYRPFAGTPVKVGREEMRLMSEQDVLAVEE